jgi:hypothetical protein
MARMQRKRPTSRVSRSSTSPRMTRSKVKSDKAKKEYMQKAYDYSKKKRAEQMKSKTDAARKASPRVDQPTSMLKKGTMGMAADKTVGQKSTKAGTYPIYKKKSDSAKNFRSAFADARKAGKKTFTWQGRKYTTKVK